MKLGPGGVASGGQQRRFQKPNQRRRRLRGHVLLVHDNARLSSTARAVSIPERTLQRRLTAEGVSYSALVDDIRRQRAFKYLSN